MPVILSDEVELPFQNVIDYSEISIKWPSSRIGPELLEYLESISGIALYFFEKKNCIILVQPLSYFSFSSYIVFYYALRYKICQDT